MTRMKISHVIKVVALAFCLVISAFAEAQVTSDFSVDADGWTVFNIATGSSAPPTWNAIGGNPSGNISFNIASVSQLFYWNAPAKFKGNLSRAYNQTLTFDLLQSIAGTDNTQNDLVIVGAGITLVYQLPAKPGTSWTHYSVLFNETTAGWHNGYLSGAAPDQLQMKRALSNITSFQIRAKYNTTAASYTAQLDNVILTMPPSVSAPSITSFSPRNALAGTTVTITGTNFNPLAAQNIVYFNGLATAPLTATATQLTVKVPVSAAFGPISALDISTGLQGISNQYFSPLFDNNKDFGGRVIPASMSRGYNTVLPMSPSGSNGFGRMDKGDLDGDGWIDLVTTETSSVKIYAFRNLASGGTVSVSSFGAAITLPSLSAVPGGGPSLAELIVTDVDGDGKPDVAASTSGNYQAGTGFLAVYRNTSTPGSISFANPVFFQYNYYSALYMATGDLDSDGRTDFVFTTGTSPGNIFISQNQSTPGNIDFAFGGSINGATTSGLSQVVIGDLTGDGKPEIVCPGYNATTLSIYQNNSSPGTISMGAVFTIPAGVSYTNRMAMADFDGDNKLDMAWSTYGSSYVYFTKNNYSGGLFDATSFGPLIQVTNTLSNPLGIAVGDINSDSKPDVVLSGYSDMAVLENRSTAGTLTTSSFTPTVLFQGSSSAGYIFGVTPVVADLDGDNKSEVAFVTSGGSVPGIYIFHNESYPVPAVTGVSPSAAAAGATVSLTGNLMYTGNVSPSVRLTQTVATVTGSPANTSTSVVNPTGAIGGNFSLTNHGLTTYSPYFKKTFGTTGAITTTSFGPKVDFALGTGTRDVLQIADFDDDGKADAHVVESFTGKIFQNTATAGQHITTTSLTQVSTTYYGTAAIIAMDIDGDGKTDVNNGYGLLQNNSTSGAISFASGPNGVYTTATNFVGVAPADFNKDGKIDLATTGGGAYMQVYENLSSRGAFVNSGSIATFSSTVNFAKPNTGGAVVAEDFDGDSYPDVIAVNQTLGSLSFYLNTKQYGSITTTSFSIPASQTTSGSQPSGIVANDFDGDGKIDVAISYFNSLFVSVYLNTSSVGTISFATPVNLPSVGKGYNVAAQDVDGDGLAEIAVIHQTGTGSFTIFKNNSTPGNASFGAAINIGVGRIPQALGFADINADQKPDLLMVGSGGAPANALMIFENMMPSLVITVTSQPNAVYSVCDGATPTITTVASGTTNITYQWQIFNSGTGGYDDLTNTGGYANVFTSSLTINSTGNFGNGTYRCKINGDFAATVYTNTVAFTVNAIPSAPSAPDVNNCGPGSVVLTASGGTNGQYLWYDQNGLIAGQNNSTYTTPVITSTTAYSVAISNGTCVSLKTVVNANILTAGCATITITTQPSDFSACVGQLATFSTAAAGTTNIVFRWQFSSDGGATFADLADNANYSNTGTSTLSINTASSFGAGRYRCKIDGDFANSVFTNDEGLSFNTTCVAPVISTKTLTTEIGGKITLDLKPLITTPNLDLTSLQITSPPASGAAASIDANGILTIDYAGKSYSGDEQIGIKACDIDGKCASQSFSLDVAGDIVVFNGISPGGANPTLFIQFIDALPETKNNTVYIFDRWENLVWHGNNYDNVSVVFSGLSDGGSALPSGVYFYKIEFTSGRKTQTGFISLRRQ